jgi:hypothetical protein
MRSPNSTAALQKHNVGGALNLSRHHQSAPPSYLPRNRQQRSQSTAIVFQQPMRQHPSLIVSQRCTPLRTQRLAWQKMISLPSVVPRSQRIVSLWKSLRHRTATRTTNFANCAARIQSRMTASCPSLGQCHTYTWK